VIREERARLTRLLHGLAAPMLMLMMCTLVCGAAQAYGTAQAESTAKAKAVQSTSKSTGSAADSEVDPTTYHIGVEDELMISVWKEPELSQVVTVRPDGKITLPLVNDVSVVGLKTNELQDVLTEKLKPFVNEPQVTVVVRTIRSRKVYIVGKAMKQGSFPLNGRTTMLQLLAEAGGLTPFAKGGSIHIVRKEGGKEVHIPFNYKKALAGQSEDPVLAPGDMVIIP
jgi:polysaccharide export outer membrane protein